MPFVYAFKCLTGKLDNNNNADYGYGLRDVMNLLTPFLQVY